MRAAMEETGHGCSSQDFRATYYRGQSATSKTKEQMYFPQAVDSLSPKDNNMAIAQIA